MLVRVTTIEAFRRFIQDASIYSTEENLLETLTGKFTGNEYTRIGTAFHKIVECGDVSFHHNDCRVVLIDNIPIEMNQQHIDTALQYKAENKGCFHELRTSKKYLIDGIEIEVSGGLDLLLGNLIRDIKTKYSSLRSIEDYTNSYQWRFYLDLFEMEEFCYDIFEFKGYNKERDLYDVSKLKLVRHEPIPCIWYAGMQRDIEKLLSQFIEYLQFKNLTHLFSDESIN